MKQDWFANPFDFRFRLPPHPLHPGKWSYPWSRLDRASVAPLTHLAAKTETTTTIIPEQKQPPLPPPRHLTSRCVNNTNYKWCAEIVTTALWKVKWITKVWWKSLRCFLRLRRIPSNSTTVYSTNRPAITELKVGQISLSRSNLTYCYVKANVNKLGVSPSDYIPDRSRVGNKLFS